jgi:hypothetical protein
MNPCPFHRPLLDPASDVLERRNRPHPTEAHLPCGADAKQGWARPIPVRYAVRGNSLVTFGDEGLAGLVAGDRVVATVHDIAGGPLLESLGVTVTDIPPAEVYREAVLAHVPLGATLAEVNARVDELCWTRRIMALVP